MSSDAENLSLILSYTRLCELGYPVDCYAPRKDELSLYPFRRANQNFSYLTTLSREELDQYAVIVCGRNAFDFPGSEVLLHYKGTIVADDTCLYEGHSVYGDIVCTCGTFNARNIPPFLCDSSRIIGCIKADQSEVASSPIWKNGEDTQQKVLYIESGHFPFGVEGRTALAREFCRMVKEHSESFFTVKPRFLPHESAIAKHRNTDHIYRYILDEFGGVLPQNLMLLDSHLPMAELISGADVCLCTYSSAHVEVVRAGKKLINICDVPSEVTADFRPNRLSHITSMMDQAMCNVSVYCLSEELDHAHCPPKSYADNINLPEQNALSSFVSIVENAAKNRQVIDGKALFARRFCGYAWRKICYFENRLDDFTLAQAFWGKVTNIAKRRLTCEEQIVQLDQLIENHIYTYIFDHMSSLEKDSIQRSFALRYISARLPDYRFADLGASLTEDCSRQDVADDYYWARLYFHRKEFVQAKARLLHYFKKVEKISYAVTDVEVVSAIEESKRLLKDLEAVDDND